MAERAEELREQLDLQRAGISRTVEQIENRVVPGRILHRRKYRMRRSLVDWRDRMFGNDEAEYPSHWYAQPAAPMGPGYGATVGGYAEEGQGGGRLEGARERMHDVGGRASEGVHGMTDRASGTMHGMTERAGGAMEHASGTMHDMGDRVAMAPQTVRRQTQGNPLALGIVAFGAGLLAATVLPESRREQQMARQATPQLQRAVEGGKEVAGEMAGSLKEAAQESAEEIKGTATQEAQALKEEARQEAQGARADAESAVRE